MPVETLTLSEQEQAVIEAAIEYCAQAQHGLYIDVPRAKAALIEAVEQLQMDHEGRWQPREAHG
jgi:hypothetical protein